LKHQSLTAQLPANPNHREVAYAPGVASNRAANHSIAGTKLIGTPARSSDRISLRGRAGRHLTSSLFPASTPAVSLPNQAETPCPVSLPSCLSEWPNRKAIMQPDNERIIRFDSKREYYVADIEGGELERARLAIAKAEGK